MFPSSADGTTNGNVRFFTENNFTLAYGDNAGDIIPYSRQILYDSGTNNLTSITTRLSGELTVKTIQVTHEQEQNLINAITRNGVYTTGFSDNSCHGPECQPAHLTISVENQNFTNTLSWTKESSKTLDGLFGIQEQLFSLTPNNTNTTSAK
jgi:hypothetical protein